MRVTNGPIVDASGIAMSTGDTLTGLADLTLSGAVSGWGCPSQQAGVGWPMGDWWKGRRRAGGRGAVWVHGLAATACMAGPRDEEREGSIQRGPAVSAAPWAVGIGWRSGAGAAVVLRGRVLRTLKKLGHGLGWACDGVWAQPACVRRAAGWARAGLWAQASPGGQGVLVWLSRGLGRQGVMALAVSGGGGVVVDGGGGHGSGSSPAQPPPAAVQQLHGLSGNGQQIGALRRANARGHARLPASLLSMTTGLNQFPYPCVMRS